MVLFMHIWILTLSLFSPEHEQKIIDYLKAPNRYNLDIDLLRAEKDNIWNYYGISSKRYALYTCKNEELKLIEGERLF